jgi:hypothetical protein
MVFEQPLLAWLLLQQWTLLLVVVAAIDLKMLAILPRGIRRTLAEPEPRHALGRRSVP